MAFQNPQALYQKTMKQAEQYKKEKGEGTGKQANLSANNQVKQPQRSAATNGATFPKSQPLGSIAGAGARKESSAGQTSSGSQQQVYMQKAIETASPGELTLLLYNGCLKFINKAKQSLEDKDIQAKHKYIVRAQDIIRELMVTLKVENDTQENMMSLYDFIHNRLVDANVNNDKKALEEAYDLVSEFRDTWKEIIKIDRQNRHGKGGQS